MITRRKFLTNSVATLFGTSFLTNSIFIKQGFAAQSWLMNLSGLLAPDPNGLMLPQGFRSRIIARSGIRPSETSSYHWHDAPDGGATFPTENNGWIYVSNSEMNNNAGGVGAIRFDAAGNIIEAYQVLDDTSRNCAGGATPWGTWLSCEEVNDGLVWECDPYGKKTAIARPALGAFAHEAVTIDTQQKILYLTEDKHDGCLYRYVPDLIDKNGIPDLSSGKLEVAIMDKTTSKLGWKLIEDAAAEFEPTRYQVEDCTRFKGGEGIVYHQGKVSFATKGDNRIWTYDTKTNQITVTYDALTHATPILTGVDNITLTQDGELVVSEDGGNLQIIAITRSNQLIPLVQLVGHNSSEITGPAFSPDGKRLYFSSQRGSTGKSSDGVTYEVTGPFHG